MYNPIQYAPITGFVFGHPIFIQINGDSNKGKL